MLKVMTLNIWNDDGPWLQRAKLIREQIDQLDPDLIGLQEVLMGEGVDLLEDILQGTGYYRAFAEAVAGWPRSDVVNGNAVISRWPLIREERVVLPTPEDHNGRAATITIVESPLGPLSFASTHLSWRFTDGVVREKQVRVLADRLDDLIGEVEFPLLMVGDFNSVRESAEIRYLSGLQSLGGKSMYFRDAWFHAGDGSDGLTWTRANPYIPHWLAPERRIDYIFVGAPRRDGIGEILSCKVICNQPTDGVWPSDHFGVFAELRDKPISADN